MKLKLSALLLCFVLMFSSLLSACANSNTLPSDESDSRDPSDSASAESERESESDRIFYKANVKIEDFNGYEFRVLTWGTWNSQWQCKDIYSDGLSSDPISSAVFIRNKNIEERFNITIVEDGSFQDPYSAAEKSARSDMDEYAMFALMMRQVSDLYTKGLVCDLKEFSDMELNQCWYDQNYNKDMSIAGHLYSTTGDLLTLDNDGTWAVLFNKVIAENEGLDDHYALVENKKWTFEYMYKASRQATHDLDGAGVMTPDDMWGMSGEVGNTLYFVLASGVKTVEKDENDLPVVAFENEKFYDVLNAAIRLNTDTNYVMLASEMTKYNSDGFSVIDDTFMGGKNLYTVAGLNRVTMYRGMEQDFGILPMPMYSEDQDGYYCPVSGTRFCTISIPITCTNTHRTGVLIEALSAESKTYLTPAYYDQTLKGKLSRDEESSRMLDLIFASRVFDLGAMYNWGGISDKIAGFRSASGAVGASKFKQVKTIMGRSIASIVDKYK